MLDYYFLWILVTAPSQKGRLPQFPIFCPLGESNFTNQLWLNPLNFLGDFGGFSTGVLPENHAHQVWTRDEKAIIQVQFTGPADIIFINPADDPRKKSE